MFCLSIQTDAMSVYSRGIIILTLVIGVFIVLSILYRERRMAKREKRRLMKKKNI